MFFDRELVILLFVPFQHFYGVPLGSRMNRKGHVHRRILNTVFSVTAQAPILWEPALRHSQGYSSGFGNE